MDEAQAFEQRVFRYQDAMNAVIDRFESPVQQFYSGTTVFVTGGSGFLGKQLVEKLFRSAKVKTVYLLLRSKKGKSTQDRLNDMLKDPVFESLRKKQPDFADKITIVEGDVAELRLGLSERDWKTICEEVDVIFHMAATIRFDEPIKVATLINVRGTRETIALAKECKKLTSFVHVSTAYTHATYSREGQEVLEQFYPCPVPPDVMIQLAETVAEDRLDAITPDLVRDWPNTYTFTKALAEELVRTTATDLPVCVVRPAIVVASRCEPTPGWLDMSCVFGPSAVFLGVLLGVLHTFHCNNAKRMAIFPVDKTNNAIIAAGWDAATRREGGDRDITVYTVADDQCLMTFAFIARILRESRPLSTNKAVWYCYLVETKSKLFFWIMAWILHLIPAYVLDAICGVLNVRPKEIPSFVKIFKLIHKQNSIYSYFLTQEWFFKNNNLKALLSRMADEDKCIYNCDLTDIDYYEYVQIWAGGVRNYLIKDGLKDTDKGGRKQMYMKYLNIIFLCAYMYVLWKILCVGVWGVGQVYSLLM